MAVGSEGGPSQGFFYPGLCLEVGVRGKHGQQCLTAAGGTEGSDAVTREGEGLQKGIGSFSSCFWENFLPYCRLCSNRGAAFCLESRGSLEGLFFLSTKHRATKKHGSAPCQELHFLQNFSNSISWESLSKSFVLFLPPFAVGVWGEHRDSWAGDEGNGTTSKLGLHTLLPPGPATFIEAKQSLERTGSIFHWVFPTGMCTSSSCFHNHGAGECQDTVRASAWSNTHPTRDKVCGGYHTLHQSGLLERETGGCCRQEMGIFASCCCSDRKKRWKSLSPQAFFAAWTM